MGVISFERSQEYLVRSASGFSKFVGEKTADDAGVRVGRKMIKLDNIVDGSIFSIACGPCGEQFRHLLVKGPESHYVLVCPKTVPFTKAFILLG